MKSILIILASILLYSNSVHACSMYKITKDGKTIVGNNEEWLSLNTQIWFESGERGKYGVMNVGFLNNFAQGGINEAGLMFDGFGMPYLEVKNTKGKLNTPIGVAVNNAMHSFATVQEVKEYLSIINLSSLSTGMIVFVDKSGAYLIVEGDEMILGNDAEQSFSNFYPSQTKNQADVKLPYYQNGLIFLNSSEPTFSLGYCSSVMNNLSQKGVGEVSPIATQYSTIYDLENLTIRFYHYNNFDNYVDIELKEELKKGNHKMFIPELFPKNTIGYQTYLMYNDSINPERFVKTCWEKDFKNKNEKDLENLKNAYANFINTIGYEWLYDKNDAKGASAIFKYGTELFPDNANLYDSLGESLYKNKSYDAAIKNYEKSFDLDPKNQNAIKMIKEIKEKI